MAKMSESKTPKPGEWWVSNSNSNFEIVFICGFDPDGDPVWLNDDGGATVSMMCLFVSDWRHEPRCTGFDWVEPSAEDPNDMPLNPVPGKVVATGTVKITAVESPDDMAAIIAEHTQQVRELTQRIGELVQQVNERDAVIEKIRTALRHDFSI